MFRSDEQACKAFQAVLQTLHLEHLWTPQEPAPAALRYREYDGGLLSSGERIILLAVFDLWDGSGNLQFRELIDSLDETRTYVLLSLVAAITRGGEAVDQWLQMHQPLPKKRPARNVVPINVAARKEKGKRWTQ